MSRNVATLAGINISPKEIFNQDTVLTVPPNLMLGKDHNGSEDTGSKNIRTFKINTQFSDATPRFVDITDVTGKCDK